MKSYLITTLFILLFLRSFAQKETHVCDVKIYQPGSSKYFVDVNYGGSNRYRSLKDSTGKDVAFSSMFNALKYMYAQGWLPDSAYVHNNYNHFILRK